jgi:ADP-ribose pyrophosphatase YjhB (NUDIX family)
MSNVYWFLFEQDGAFLLAQRKDDKPPFAGRWALPGGEAQLGDTPKDVAHRVGNSELGVNVMGTAPYDTITVEDGGVEQTIDVYRVGFEGELKFRESGPYVEVGWATPDELEDLDIELPEALTALLKGLKR